MLDAVSLGGKLGALALAVGLTVGLGGATKGGEGGGAAVQDPVQVALTMGDGNGDGALQLREWLGLCLCAYIRSGHRGPEFASDPSRPVAEQLLPEAYRVEGEALLLAKNRHAVRLQRDFQAEDRERDGALAPAEIAALLRRGERLTRPRPTATTP